MNYPSYRLFDSVSYQIEHFSKPDMLNSKVNGAWKSYSTQEVSEIVNRFSAGLLQKGVRGNNFTAEGSDKIAIISNNRPEWIFTDLAVQQLGAILVPLYPTTSLLELEFILNESQAKYLFASNLELLQNVKSVKSPYLQGLYTFDPVEGVDNYTEILSLATQESLQKVEAIKKGIPNTHIATIIYTSGTTGTPKGVMLSHENIISNVYFAKASFPFPDQPQTKMLSFLPLNHIFEKTLNYIYLFSGNSIFYAESLETIGENLKEVQPNVFATVPRLLEKVYEKIISKGKELRGIKRAFFFWSVGLARKYDNRKPLSIVYKLKLAIARRLVFTKWKESLGGKIDFIVTGGAATSEKLLRIFNGAGIPVFEGYGPTEHSPVICVNRNVKGGNYFGTVGPPIEGVEVKLADDGEILVKSPCVMKGYFNRPDLTNEVLKDGWLYTGDIGIWVENKFLKITDRKKELFKTSGGKYVAPQPIENKLKESQYVEQVIIVGDDRKYVGALIVPSFQSLRVWMKEHHIPKMTNEEIVSDPRVLHLMENVVKHYNEYFNRVEQIKKFVLLPKEWNVETGEMSPKLSLRRKIIMDKYSNEIEKIYS
jgi:long-chain acyl-CoA synthetase